MGLVAAHCCKEESVRQQSSAGKRIVENLGEIKTLFEDGFARGIKLVSAWSRTNGPDVIDAH